MKWETITDRQRAVLCLLREYGPARFVDGFRRLAWWHEGDALAITGPSVMVTALAARGLIGVEAGTWRITPSGRDAIATVRRLPPTALRAHRKMEPALLTDQQMAAVSGYFPVVRGLPRGDDRATVSGIVDVLRRGLMWGEAHPAYGGERILWRRFTNWGRAGVLDDVLCHLTEEVDGVPRLMVTASHLARHPSGRHGAALGWFPSLLAPEELGAAA